MQRVNLFLIGVQKAGTSWLYYLLDQHPDIYMSEVKELYFFGNAGTNGPNTLDSYHSHFPFDENYRYFGEATPVYYREREAADQIRAYNPGAKILAIVRDPIQRILSQYRYHKQLGLVPEAIEFDEAIRDRTHFLRDSHYEQTLPIYEEIFGPDQFMIVSLENAREDPQRLWTELQSFLDLSEAPLPNPNPSPENPTGSARFRRLYRATVRPVKNYVPGLYQRMLQNSVVRSAKRALLTILGTAEPESISAEQKRRLRDEFAPTYEYLHSHGFDNYPATDR